MRIFLALVAILYSAAAMAQNSPAQSSPAAGSPPTVGDKPLLQVKPRGEKAAAAAPKTSAPGKPTSIAKRLQACLEIDDGTKGRLDCYDAIFPPKPNPNPKAKPAERVMDCHFAKEQDERLNCYNGFAEKIPKF